MSNIAENFDSEPEDKKDGVKQEIKEKIAWSYSLHELTDDNVSRWVGLSGFEQAILYEFGPVLVEKFEELKSKILGMERDLRGGSRLRKLSNLDGYEQEFGF